jgi:hypothetical protein
VKTAYRPKIVNAIARYSVFLMPFLYAGVGAAAARSCAEEASAAGERATFVEVSTEFAAKVPNAVQYLEQAGDAWCRLGRPCLSAVYVEGEYTPPEDARVVRVIFRELGSDGMGAYRHDLIRIEPVPKSHTWWDPSSEEPCVSGTHARLDEILAHELGHAMGVRHSCDRAAKEGELGHCTPEHDWPLVMNPVGSSCEFGRYEIPDPGF